MERERILARIKSFYTRNDPGRKYKTFEPMLNYAMTEGLDKLNQLLLRKYGETIVVDSFPTGDRDDLRHKIELFYLKHDPAKIDKPDDLEAIVDFVTIHGIHNLDEKLFIKYGERLLDAKLEDAIYMIQCFYKRLKIIKSEKDCKALALWGLKNSFCTLNLRLIRKYGKGLGEMDSKKQKEDLRRQIYSFYELHDPSQIDDEENMERITEWTLINGVMQLNEKLQAKYQANLNTIEIKEPSSHSENSNPELLTKTALASENVLENKVYNDEKRLEHLRTYINLFLAKHDTDRLYNGGVTEIIGQLKTFGEQKVEDKLCSKYGEGLKSIEQQYLHLERKLELFYKIHDPERLKTPMEGIIGWTIVHGEDKLNHRLMGKYDEDLESTGLRRRLKFFYSKVGEERSEAEISKIACYGMTRGLKKLNKRLKKKYKLSLEDIFAIDEQIADGGSYLSDRLTQATFSSIQSSSTTINQRSNRTAQQAIRNYYEKRNPLVSMVEMDEKIVTRKNSMSKEEVDTGGDDENDKETDLDEYPEVLDKKHRIDENTLFRAKTKEVIDVETENQKNIEAAFSCDDLDMRKGNRKSLKAMRHRRGSSQFRKSINGTMISKLARFLDHVEGYRVEQSASSDILPVQHSTENNEVFSYALVKPMREDQEGIRLPTSSVVLREKKAATNLVSSLMKFYRRHDKKKANGKAIRIDVEYTLKHGKDALNEKLLRQYGESLNSMNNRQKTKYNKKLLTASRSNRNFLNVPQETMEELEGILEE